MPREMDLEVKVGFFVVIALVCLVGFIFSISDFSVFKKGDGLWVKFQYANGLKKGAPVRVAGVDAGHIRQIAVEYNRATHHSDVTVDVWLAEGHSIPADSTFLINQLGLLGEKYLEIMPGSAAALLSAGATVRGEDPVPMETITKTIGSLGTRIETALGSFNSGVLTEANKAAFSAILSNAAVISARLRNGEGTAGTFLMDPGVYDNLDEMTADLRQNPWKLFYRPKK